MARAIHTGVIVIAVGLGCSRDVPKDGTAMAGSSSVAALKENRVYDIASVNDLLQLQSTYLQQAAAGFDGRFEVRFTANIPQTGWSLAPEPGKDLPAIDLVLSGKGAVVPVPGTLAARSVRIEGLVLTGPVGLSSSIEVRTDFTMVDSAVIDGRGGVPASQAPYLAVRAHGVRGKKVPATLTVERSWFVRNWQASGSTHGAVLFGLEQHERDGGFFGEVRFRDCAFIGNAFAKELRLAYALDVTLERCLFYKTWPSGVLIAADLAEKVQVIDSILVAENLEHVASIGEDISPIVMTGTRIYARSYTATTAIPAALKIDRGALADRSGIDGKVGPIDGAAKMALGMPSATLRDQLMQALKP